LKPKKQLSALQQIMEFTYSNTMLTMDALLSMHLSNTMHNKDKQFHIMVSMSTSKMALPKEPKEILLKLQEPCYYMQKHSGQLQSVYVFGQKQ
jgi:hypothetical protein